MSSDIPIRTARTLLCVRAGVSETDAENMLFHQMSAGVLRLTADSLLEGTDANSGKMREWTGFVAAEMLEMGEIDFEAGTLALSTATLSGLALTQGDFDRVWPEKRSGQDLLDALPQPKNHRPAGTGLQAADADLIKQMHKLLSNKIASSPTQAAWTVAKRDGSGASGSGSPESKVSRLVGRYKARYGE